MSFAVVTAPPPLSADADGVIRVANTRVTLDTLVLAFRTGATAEAIADRYPALRLADVYSALGYYLHHQSEIEDYLQQRQILADETRLSNEARFPSGGVRDRLIARRNTEGTGS